jgi:hypothetical protein
MFRGEPIGKYFNSHDCGIIQFQESENLSAEAIAGAVRHIKEGAFLRVIWWFDRFDNKRFRSHLVCIPPYENAPKCGVFATFFLVQTHHRGIRCFKEFYRYRIGSSEVPNTAFAVPGTTYVTRRLNEYLRLLRFIC